MSHSIVTSFMLSVGDCDVKQCVPVIPPLLHNFCVLLLLCYNMMWTCRLVSLLTSATFPIVVKQTQMEIFLLPSWMNTLTRTGPRECQCTRQSANHSLTGAAEDNSQWRTKMWYQVPAKRINCYQVCTECLLGIKTKNHTKPKGPWPCLVGHRGASVAWL